MTDDRSFIRDNDSYSDHTKIALMQAELHRVNARLIALEKSAASTTALMNKYGGGLAVGILIIGAVWAVIVAFGANISQKFSGH